MLEDIIHSLLGCEWGRGVTTPDDTEPCMDRAGSIVVLHYEGRERAMKVCPKHRSRICEETTPTVAAP
jgi:hypothetical protein